LLEKWGVRLETAIGKQFNPSYQSALSIVPSPDSEPGTVVNELKKAAFYKDKLIRVGEVVVAGQSGSQQEV
jgi:molecular chaperone GrpE (heat shock protein)